MEEIIHSFLMVGQSNMAGRGDLTPENALAPSDCFMLRMGRWQPLHEPINPDRPESGPSLAASFAEQYRKEMAPIGLIPCADGGTSITEWQRGDLLFDHAVMQAKLAARTSKLTGILWHQGEYDCLNPAALVNYPPLFLATMTAFRQELRDLPIVLGELGYPANGFTSTPAALVTEFNRRLPALAAEMPNCCVVSAKALNCRGDGLHFDTPSLREFGRRYYRAWQELAKKH